jgi:hypothetical protein
MDQGEEAIGVQFWLVLSVSSSLSLIGFRLVPNFDIQKSEAKQLTLEAIRTADLRDIEEPHKIKDQKKKTRKSQ